MRLPTCRRAHRQPDHADVLDLLSHSGDDPDSPTPTSDPTTPSQSFGPNFEWVEGRLQYSDLEGGTWTLEFTDNPGKADPYGGKFVLREGVPEGFQAGDLVRVTGSVAEQQMGINMAGTYYEVKSIVHAGVER